MEYISTRGGLTQPVSGTQAVIQGMAEDGGLFVPLRLPMVTYEAVNGLSYAQVAQMILALYFPEVDLHMWDKVLTSYVQGFDDARVTPVKTFGTCSYLELFHGPTASFKDMALGLLPDLMQAAYDLHKLSDTIFLLVATSGDTGSAALKAFAHRPGVEMAVFYPDNGVSPIQQVQMDAAATDSARVYAIHGNFDDAQSAVKSLFAMDRLKELEASYHKRLSSANSINLGRLVAQIVYYYVAYQQLVAEGTLLAGEVMDISVPTGNFGDILAGIYAKMMGLPIGKVICASNANRVLTDFIEQGVYYARRPFHKTTSPSMDILISSNLERFLYLSSGGDAAAVRQAYQDLRQQGSFTWPHPLPDYLVGASLDDAGTQAEIKAVWEEWGYLIDPHTAVAAHAARLADHHCLVVSTASPYKFPTTVLQALGQGEGKESAIEAVNHLAQWTGTTIPHSIQPLLTTSVTGAKKIEPGQIQWEVIRLLEGHHES